MSHAALQAIAFAVVVLSSAGLYLTGLSLQSQKRKEPQKTKHWILVLLAAEWIGAGIFLADTL